MDCIHWKHKLHVFYGKANKKKKALIMRCCDLQLNFTAFISASRMMPSVTETTTTNLTRVLVIYPYLFKIFSYHGYQIKRTIHQLSLTLLNLPWRIIIQDISRDFSVHLTLKLFYKYFIYSRVRMLL